MKAIDPTISLAELVVAEPRRARLFDQLRLDYCCNGQRSLEEACGQRGLHAATVVELLTVLDREPALVADEPHDVADVSISELCEHIVTAHHDRMRATLPEISELVATVVRVHQVQRPELQDLRRLFEGMREELESHMTVEEETLFPICRAIEAGDADDVDEGLIVAHETEHESVGEALVALREVSGGYESKRALCGTHRRMLENLRDLELDLHQHVHEENNILFPRVRALAGAQTAR